MPGALDYQIVDFDNHYYEPDDCFTRHMSPSHRDHAVNIRRGADGLGRIFVGDERYGWFRVTQTDYISPPGFFRDYFDHGVGKPDMAEHLISPREIPAFMEAKARLDLMDTQGVEAAVLLPSLGVSVIGAIANDVGSAHAHIESFNRWVEEDWGFANSGQIFAAPMALLFDVDRSVAELNRVLAAGARLIVLVPRPIGGRSPADPVFDPFWARVQEAGAPVAFHAGDSGFERLYACHWGEDPDVPVHHFSPLQHFLAMSERPIVDTLAALVLQNLFGRFPTLQVISIENGSSWVPSLLKGMDKAYAANRQSETLGGVLTELPSSMFKTHLHVAPFPEDDIRTLIEVLGSDRVLMGSDYPHPEGLVEPLEFAQRLDAFDAKTRRAVLHDNGARLLALVATGASAMSA